MKEKIITTLTLIIGLLVWILYLCDSEMANYGIYTIFSYKTHEVMALIPFLGIIITAICFFYKARKMIKEKNMKSHMFLTILMLVLCMAQMKYIRNTSQTVISSSIASVDRIDLDRMSIVVNSNGSDVILECPQAVLEMFQTDGTKYHITYEWKKGKPNNGKLWIAQCID